MARASAGRNRALEAQRDQKRASRGHDVAAMSAGKGAQARAPGRIGRSSMVITATGRRGTTRPGSPRREASRGAPSLARAPRGRTPGRRIDPNARKWCHQSQSWLVRRIRHRSETLRGWNLQRVTAQVLKSRLGPALAFARTRLRWLSPAVCRLDYPGSSILVSAAWPGSLGIEHHLGLQSRSLKTARGCLEGGRASAPSDTLAFVGMAGHVEFAFDSR